MEKERVVITGLGAVSPIGIGKDVFLEGLLTGKSGVKKISSFDTSDFSVQIGAEITDFVPENYVDKKEVSRIDRVQQFAFAAAKEAIEDSHIELDKVDPERVGVYVTSGVGGIITLEQQVLVNKEKGPSRVSPFLVPALIIDEIPAYIAIKYGFKGETLAAVAACASSGKTIGQALYAIERGDLDVIVAGGAEAPLRQLLLLGLHQ